MNTKKKIYSFLKRFTSKNNMFPTIEDFGKNGISYDKIKYHYNNLDNLKKKFMQKNPNFVEGKEELKVQTNSSKEKIMETYKNFFVQNARYPSYKDLEELKILKHILVYYYYSLGNLKKEFEEKYPDLITHVDNTSKVVFTSKRFEDLREDISKYKRFFVTTAVNKCDVDINFYNAIKTSFCVHNNAALLVLPSAFKNESKDWNLDDVLHSDYVVFDNIELNKNLFIRSIKINAKSIDPITGLTRFGNENSFIYASPKQRLKVAPVRKNKTPRIVMTTGALTKPKYNDKLFLNDRTSYIADYDHAMGGLIVEIEDDKIFHIRPVQANQDGSFCDAGWKFFPDGRKEWIGVDAIVCGDIHAGEQDTVAMGVTKDMIRELSIPKVFVHDVFNGLSINHHDKDKHITLARRSVLGLNSLEQELITTTKVINYLADVTDEVLVVKSNHDTFLDRYLEAGLYIQDPQNHKVSLMLAYELLDGRDPLLFACKRHGLMPNVTFLKKDESYMLHGIELGQHGHIGAGGSKGNIVTLDSAYGKCIFAHQHVPQILRNAMVVGTLSVLDPEYVSGATGWMHTNCIINSDGSRQLINIINGKWRT